MKKRMLRRYRRSLFVFFLFCFCAFSCSPSNTAPTSQSGAAYVPRVVAGDFAPGQLKTHYLKHRYEFGDITTKDYLDSARALLNAQPGRDVLEKRRDNDDILHYRVSTGEFAVMTKDGRIRTYFKTNYRYWLRQ